MPNKSRLIQIAGSICAPQGFEGAAVFCGIKTLGTGKGSHKGAKPDLGLIVSDVPAAVAGLFTTNKVCAAPVKLSAKVSARGRARAIVVNSGNANACTGRQGMSDAKAMARIGAETVAVYGRRRRGGKTPAAIDRPYGSIRPNDVLVCSTGRIGVAMPIARVERGIRLCAPLLGSSARHGRDVA